MFLMWEYECLKGMVVQFRDTNDRYNGSSDNASVMYVGGTRFELSQNTEQSDRFPMIILIPSQINSWIISDIRPRPPRWHSG